MSDCPRCGRPLDPDAAGCFACAQGEPPLLRRSAPAPRSNPAWGWMIWGATCGGVVGLVCGLVGVVVNLLAGGGPGVVLPGSLAFGGALLGALGVLLWKSLLRPVLLALFASPETFEREYGKPQEQDVAREDEPPRARLTDVTFRRNPTRSWLLWGLFGGAALGSAVGAVVTLLEFSLGGRWPRRAVEDLLAASTFGALIGGVGGALVAVIWKAILRPVWLALFFADDFAREYGTPEEQGRIGRTKP